MNENYNSDKPIENQSHDRFNRYKFSKRIAETIMHRKNDDGLVIGLYGIWGEGKTSILNMIETELDTSDEILIVKFNPWRFKDEDKLILNFFKNISKKLDQELETVKTKIGDFLKKYGSITSVFNLDLTQLGETLSDTELEELKNRVNFFLKESNKKIVIVIDDIDRLDKQELFSLFKLIKLTGDFTKTYYILSFDDEMVASAIGERFAEGNKASGHNFLEKIIQIPLRIPQALSTDLLNYLFEILNKILSENDLDLGTDESQTVGYEISQHILPKIKTPRLALRYGNSLAFLIPLLKGEVNISDLILFEAVKLFYPEHYEFIKSSPQFFIESYYEKFGRDKDNTKIEEFKDKLNKINNNYSKVEQNSVINLLKRLFPMTKEALSNHDMSNMNNKWIKEKRIVTPKYFDRYFIYSVPKNDISDTFFEQYIKNLTIKSYDTVSYETAEIFKTVEPSEYLQKIGFYEDSLEWNQRQIIVQLICENQTRFEGMKGGTLMFNLHNPRAQAAITITRIISKQDNEFEKLEFAKTLMSDKIDYRFSQEILRWFSVGETENDRVLNDLNLSILKKLMLDRALNDCEKSKSNLFQKYEEFIFNLLHYWHQENSTELKDYISKLIQANSEIVADIIWSLTSTIYSSSTPEPYKVDFKNETFKTLQKYVDIDEFTLALLTSYRDEIDENEAVFYDNDKGQTKINALRQFIHWKKLEDEQNEQE